MSDFPKYGSTFYYNKDTHYTSIRCFFSNFLLIYLFYEISLERHFFLFMVRNVLDDREFVLLMMYFSNSTFIQLIIISTYYVFIYYWTYYVCIITYSTYYVFYFVDFSLRFTIRFLIDYKDDHPPSVLNDHQLLFVHLRSLPNFSLSC